MNKGIKRMVRFLIGGIILIGTSQLQAAVYPIGPLQTYTSPNAFYNATENGTVSLMDGDTLLIDAATYSGQDALAVWKKNNLLIRGVGGKPHLRAAGQYIWGKGIWVAAGNNIRVENIEFSEASVPDMNGAGIRVDGNGLIVRNCYFHNNENGILTNNSGIGTIDVAYSEFSNNGFGDGFSHNIYVGHVDKFILEYCYMHHCNVGNAIKTRADTNIVISNRIMDEITGNSSMLLDMANGGLSIVTGNIFHQGANAQNGRSVSFGTEGTNPIMELYMTNNTFVNERFNGRLVSVNPATTVSKLTNCILVDYNVLVEGGGSLDTSNVVMVNTIAQAGIDGNNFNYDLLANSIAIDAGMDPGNGGGFSLTPVNEYLHSTSCNPRPIFAPLDIGAYEFLTPPSGVYYVSNNGNDSNSGTSLANAFLTLQHASDVVVAGDSVYVENGTYVGFDHRNTNGTAMDPIVFKTLGNSVLINQSGPIRDDGINIENADYIVLDGFICNDMTGNGNGIRVVLADFCEVRNCSCDNNAERGIFTAFTDDILIENNVCTNSVDEHGIYVSNSSDRPIIRYNECYGNNNIGIHMNGDLSAGGDGIISDAQVYGNYIHDNNLAAGINMDGCVNPVIYNNLIYNNHTAQGIALFQQDGAVVTSGAKIYNNTIIVPSDGRWGILVKNGANVGTEIYNNIILNQHAWRGCITIESQTGFTSDYNLLDDKMSATGDGSAITLAEWQALGFDANSILAGAPSSIFLNFAGNDYHLASGSQALNSGSSIVNFLVTNDIEGNPRPISSLYDMGAYESTMVLAVEILDPFIATFKNGVVQLKWSTAIEINSSHFEIYRSHDKENWEVLDKVSNNGNSMINNYYQYIDKNPLLDRSYYRLFEIDMDGRKNYIGTDRIDNNSEGELLVYPNPSSDIIYLKDFPLVYENNFRYKIYSNEGVMVKSGNTNSDGISIKDLSSGIYLLNIDMKYKQILKQFIVR